MSVFFPILPSHLLGSLVHDNKVNIEVGLIRTSYN